MFHRPLAALARDARRRQGYGGASRGHRDKNFRQDIQDLQDRMFGSLESSPHTSAGRP